MGNEVKIDITVSDNNALDKAEQKAKTAGEKIGKSLEQAVAPINTAFSKTSNAIGNMLDKIEREAWESGRGTDAAFQAALASVRNDFENVRDVGKRTGASLESDLGQALLSVRRAAGGLSDSLKPVAEEAPKIDRAFDKAARSISNQLNKIKHDAWDSGTTMDRAFTDALGDLERRLERARQEGKRTGASLESDLGNALREVREEAAKLDKQLEETGRESGGSLGNALSDGLSGGFDVGSTIEGLMGGAGGGGGMWATAGAAIGGTIAKAEWDAFQAYFEQQKIGGLISAQQGGTAAAGRALGQVAGNAYYDSFADSVEAGGEALSGILGQGLVDTTDSQAEIQELTNMAATATQVVGDDAQSIARAAKQLLVNGLADNAKQALDMITYASQSGANAAGDLMDTLEEYPIQFKKLGLSGQEALGLINQGMEAGARNSDIVADGLKELSIRAIDGSAQTVRGFQSIGLNAQEMGAAFAAGGEKAHDALGRTLEGLQAIKDPTLRSQAAVDLFGTKAEDLGDALYSLDLDGASKEMDGFADSTGRAAKVIKENQPPLETLGKGMEQGANMAIGLAMGLDNAGVSADRTEKSFTNASGRTKMLVLGSKDLAGAQEQVRNATQDAVDAADSYVDTLDEVISRQEKLANQYTSSARASLNYQESIDAANEALKQNGKNIDDTTEKGRNNQSALFDLSDATWANIQAMEQQGKTSEEIQGFMVGARDQFVNTAVAMGFSAEQANALADQLHLIPGDYNARVQADTRAAYGAIDDLIDTLNWVQNHKWFAHVGAIGAGLNLGHAYGGAVGAGLPWGAATGGARGSLTTIDEVGPEVVELPTGSRVMTAGATRAMAESGAFGGGGVAQVVLSWEPSGDPILDAIMKGIRARVKNEHGGSVTQAFNQRSVA